jgi:hypothetical protein
MASLLISYFSCDEFPEEITQMLWQKKERGNKNLERVNCEEEQVLKVVKFSEFT